MVLSHRLFDRVTVHRGRRRIHEPLDIIGGAGFQDVERPADIDVESRAGIFVTLQEPQGGQVHHAVDIFHGGIENIRLQDIAADFKQPAAGVLEGLFDILMCPASEIIVNYDFFNIFLQQLLDHVGADQPRPAVYQYP